MSEVTLYEAIKKQGGVARLQATNLKLLAGKIASLEPDFDKKMKFMISTGHLDNQAYTDLNKKKEKEPLQKIQELGANENSLIYKWVVEDMNKKGKK